jgi:hypothetical protein
MLIVKLHRLKEDHHFVSKAAEGQKKIFNAGIRFGTI